MIEFNKAPGQKILELGCGDRRHPNADVAVDVRPAPHVDFVVNMELPFEGPQAISSGEFDAVLCVYALEHVTWRKIPQLLSEVLRVLKPGGKAVFVTPNTQKQIEWAEKHPEGWDGKGFFESVSGLLFGDCDYPDNTHKCYLSPAVAGDLFQTAGFRDVVISPAGARGTDMIVEATKPLDTPVPVSVIEVPAVASARPVESKPSLDLSASQLYDKHYFNGGGKVGGYAREGYWDYPVHDVTAQHILAKKPESVLEIGCARGYVLKRIQDAGVNGFGMEVSKHCVLTRACNGIVHFDVCTQPWPFDDQSIDLCYSIATLEHIPEKYVPHVLSEMKRVSKRALHGVDFGAHDDGFDKTHCTLRPVTWWAQKLSEHAKGYPCEIVDKESLEKGEAPKSVIEGDGRLKVNVGSCSVMFRHGWENLDVLDMSHFARAYGYKFRRHDVRDGMPYGTGAVDFVNASHVLEHLSYADGLALLKEFRRVLRPDGLVRIAVPDAQLLTLKFTNPNEYGELSEFDEINDGCEKAKTDAGKLWALLHEGHASCYDHPTLEAAAKEAGLQFSLHHFRHSLGAAERRLDSEIVEMFPDLSLFATLRAA